MLGKTLGVPLFQEQAMKIAIVAAGFTPGEADGLRRSMAAFRRSGQIERYHTKLVEGMVARGYERDFAEACFHQIEGFGYYGFPESHAASFALLVYVSAWLKCHYPDVFCAAILNAQPMGFYAPAQLVRDAVDHGVEVREVDVNHSHWDTTLEPRQRRGPLMTAVRLGFRQIKGLPEQEAQRIVTARLKPYRTLEELRRRAGLRRATLVTLAEADAFRSLGLDRRQALWAVQALKDPALPLFDHAMDAARPGSNLPAIEGCDEPWLELPEMGLGEHVIEDYATLRLSLKAHPLALLRDWLTGKRAITARQLWHADPGRRVTVCGLVLVRQRPGSAKGVIFATLEDETGFANLIVWPNRFEQFRATVMTARLLAATGTLQREGRVIHVIAERLTDLTPSLRRLRDHAVDPKMLRRCHVPRRRVQARAAGPARRDAGGAELPVSGLARARNGSWSRQSTRRHADRSRRTGRRRPAPPPWRRSRPRRARPAPRLRASSRTMARGGRRRPRNTRVPNSGRARSRMRRRPHAPAPWGRRHRGGQELAVHLATSASDRARLRGTFSSSRNRTAPVQAAGRVKRRSSRSMAAAKCRQARTSLRTRAVGVRQDDARFRPTSATT